MFDLLTLTTCVNYKVKEGLGLGATSTVISPPLTEGVPETSTLGTTLGTAEEMPVGPAVGSELGLKLAP